MVDNFLRSRPLGRILGQELLNKVDALRRDKIWVLRLCIPGLDLNFEFALAIKRYFLGYVGEETSARTP